MDTTIRKGSICKFDTTLDVSGWAEELKKTYRRMRRLNADYYIVLRNDGNGGFLCVPLTLEKCAHYVRLVINSKSYYADYITFFSVQENWLSTENVRIANPLGSVDKIYEMRKAHTLRKLEWDRKKEARKREEKRLSSELKSLSKGKFPKEQASATVAWNMTHPFQGGRTGSK